MIISIILSCLSVLLAVATLAVALSHIRKIEKTLLILEQYINQRAKEVAVVVVEGNKNIVKEICSLTEVYTQLFEKIEQLEKGVVPDYEAAKEAAESVNTFNAGLSNLLGYDPFEALRKSREKGGGAE